MLREERESSKSTIDKALDKVQLYLDIAGLIPVIGIPFDIASGTVSLTRGDVLGASLSAIAIFEVAGQGAGLAKIGRRLGRAVEFVHGETRASRELIRRIRLAEDPAKVAEAMERAHLNVAAAIETGFKSQDEIAKLAGGLGAGDLVLDTSRVIANSTEVVAKALKEGDQFKKAVDYFRSGALNSIEDARKFEKRLFGKRFVDEDTLSDVQGLLEDLYRENGLKFKGIFTGKGVNEFIPTLDDSGKIVGGQINLVGTSRKQPLIRIIDEVSHATDAADPNFIRRFERLKNLGQASSAERAREFAHFQTLLAHPDRF